MTCSPSDGSTGSSSVGASQNHCNSDYKAVVRYLYGDSAYILLESFYDSDCATFEEAKGFIASGNCEGTQGMTPGFEDYAIARLEINGTASVQTFYDSLCSELSDTYTGDENAITSYACDSSALFKWYTSSNAATSEVSGSNGGGSSSATPSKATTPIQLSPGAMAGEAIGVIIIMVIVGIYLRRRYLAAVREASRQQSTFSHAPDTPGNADSVERAPREHSESAPRGQTGLWNDDVITAKRIPRDKVNVQKIISRGAFGEVYAGVFNGQQVAVKMLLPETRENLQHVNEFLAEAKMTATMDHPRIVSFIGVAWDALSDLCVVLEFMDGGDLRTLLQEYESNHHPVGFDREKTTIALHVCHALVYLHSLKPPIIHRDLKSRNILLNRLLEAKLTDFGISRERLDKTMTAGVGTSLWMAPEVMVSGKYGVEADMFSFGVVLSELDLHTLPYAQVKEDASNRQLPDAVLLPQVAMGKVRVAFSDAESSMAELGYDCVQVNPGKRPTAAVAIYRLQGILSTL
ncbi:hypothetical protein BBJ28_00009022 [Nothophytophthora sp. Chile5]|nr:hypothetical protein BBJ28_00009022 [Nothophytophthora sp. Chile5]